ncbi:EamA family transporter [Anaerocolumna sedimenticola]|uniref:EamA family transporter n=1 Tax=Anaerocolumna sedimenticola TaxID=2696063 RepID=A0A6P1TT68_9FIRM|nr:DMT family transporter [Anaerocolumna sedimenticola]QHQ63472.1 EamA family transporter [Anaerocolumna sedimenticola]
MEHTKGKIYLLSAFSLAGTSVITGHILTGKLNSFTITTVSLGILLLCLSPFYYRKVVKTIRLLTNNDWKMILFQAIFGIFLFRTFLLYGVKLTSTVEAGILTGATPAITSLFALIFLKEQLSVKTAFGICCTVMGIVLLQAINLHSLRFSMEHFYGNLLILCAASSESSFNILSRKHNTKVSYDNSLSIHPMVQTLLVSAIAFLLSLIPAYLENPLESIQTIGLREWVALVWYGLIVTAVAFVFFFEGVKRCSPYTIAAFSGMIPFTSMLLSLFFLKETIGGIQWLGGFLIIFSMLLIGTQQKTK